MGIIKTSNLVHEYEKRDENGEIVGMEQALKGISAEVNRGEFIAILGHNGSGKSTFAKHLNALLLPSGGEVLVCDMDTKAEKNLWAIRKSAGMVFQNPDNQIVATVVEEDVGFGPENLGVPTDEIWARVKESLKKVGMYAYRKHSPNRLSGGQKQRVAVAGVLAMRPDCILLDEPTSMLDPKGREEVLKTVKELNEKEKITVLLITHYMEEVVFADRVLVMNQGELVMQGTPREIFSRGEELQRMGLTVPVEEELAGKLRANGYGLPKGILNREEFVEAFCSFWKQSGCERRMEAKRKPIEAVSGENETFFGAERTTNGTKSICPQNSILELSNVSYSYSPGTAFEMKALTDVNLKIREGEFVGIIGHTGSGKSTMIQLFNGLEKPGAGTVFFDGQDIFADGFSRKWLRGQVGLVFQYPEYQLFESTVFRDVCFGPKNLGLSEADVKERAEEALRLTRVPEELWENSPLELSGGQKRRVAIAGVLAMRPKVLVLDEPTAGLDPKGHREILRQVDSIRKATGMTIVLVSHNMEDVARYADHLVVMHHGRLALEGTPRQIFAKEEELQNVGLLVPEVTALMKELAAKKIPVPNDVLTVEEAACELAKALENE